MCKGSLKSIPPFLSLRRKLTNTFPCGSSLGVLPLELNKLLIIVVVLSMALTPALNEAGRRAAEIIDDKFNKEDVCSNFNT